MANTLTKTGGDNQLGRPGTALVSQFWAKIADGATPAVGVTVTFAIASYPGGATGQFLTLPSGTTDQEGNVAVLLVLGNVVGTYTVTMTAVGIAGSPLTFTATAAQNTYTLQSTVTPAGTLKAYLISPIAGLTVPAFPSLVFAEDTLERMDVQAGVVDVEQIDVDFIEDYSTYTEGFWLHIMTAPWADLQVTLNEGSGEKHFFFGTLQFEATQMPEFDLTPSNFQHRGTMHFLSYLTLLKQVAFSLVALNCFATAPPSFKPAQIDGAANSTVYFTSFFSLLAMALSIGTGQAYALSDISAPAADDIMLSSGIGGHIQYYGVSALTIRINEIQAFQANNVSSNSYPYIWDFVSAVCTSLGLIPHYYYDVGAGRHKIQLLTRGRSFGSTYLTLSTASQSTLIPGTPNLVRFIQITSGPPNLTGMAYGGGIFYFDAFTGAGYDTEPVGWKADMSFSVPIGNSQNSPHNCMPTYVIDGSSNVWTVDDIQYWDCVGGVYVASDPQTGGSVCQRIDHTLATYYAKRLAGLKRCYERTYPDLKANDGSTNSQLNVKLGVQTQISDGSVTKNFYASEVRKNVLRSNLFVRWQEI